MHPKDWRDLFKSLAEYTSSHLQDSGSEAVHSTTLDGTILMIPEELEVQEKDRKPIFHSWGKNGGDFPRTFTDTSRESEYGY